MFIFQIRLDRLVDKWSGSIEVGITTHNPNSIDFPATMTNMRSGKKTAANQGPVVQSIVSLTSLLVVKKLTVLVWITLNS